MDRVRWAIALLALIALSAAACSDSTSTTPTSPTPTTITDTFSGTLAQNGAATYQITTLQSGQVRATLSSLLASDADTPPNVGLSLGTWNGSACQIVIAKDDANVASTVVGQVSAAGVLCVRVYDVGTIVSSVDYTINVNHP